MYLWIKYHFSFSFVNNIRLFVILFPLSVLSAEVMFIIKKKCVCYKRHTCHVSLFTRIKENKNYIRWVRLFLNWWLIGRPKIEFGYFVILGLSVAAKHTLWENRHEMSVFFSENKGNTWKEEPAMDAWFTSQRDGRFFAK